MAKGPATPHATNRHQQPSPSHSVKLSPPPHPSQPLGSPGAARTPGASHQEEPLVKSPGPPGRPPPAGLQPRGGELLFLPDQDAAHPKSISSVRAFWRGGRGGGSLLVTPGSGKPPEAGKGLPGVPPPWASGQNQVKAWRRSGTFEDTGVPQHPQEVLVEWGHATLYWAEPTTPVRHHSQPRAAGKGKMKTTEHFICQRAQQRCSDPVRSLMEALDSVERGASSRHRGEGTPRAGGSTRDTGATGHHPAAGSPEAGSLRCAAQLANRGRVFWVSGTDAAVHTHWFCRRSTRHV